MTQTGRSPLREILGKQQLFDCREYFLRREQFTEVLQCALRDRCSPVLRLNRRQAGGACLVHRLVWSGLTFISVSTRPLMVC